MSIGRIFRLRPLSKQSSVKRAVPVLSAALLAVALAPLPVAATADASRQPGGVALDRPHRPMTIAAAQRQIAVFDHQAEIASEQLNAVRVRLATARQTLSTLQADVARQRTRVNALRADVVGAAVTDYQRGAGLSTTTSFLTANDPKRFLTGLASKAVEANQEAGLLTTLSEQQRRLGVQEQQAQREVAAIAADRAAIVGHQTVLDHKTEQAKQVLAQLRRKQRERLARRQARAEKLAAARASRAAQRVSTIPAPAPTTPSPAQSPTPAPSPAPVASVPVSGRASVAVNYALAQVGDPYVYGAAGPDAFDCSGLTMAAWAAAGVSIPHAASMQTSAGTPVPISSLMPGDLVFYYSPISHVGMYIGNGQVVHAPHTGSYVQVVPLNSMPISMAVRIG